MALIAFVDERTKSKYQKLKDGQPAEVLVNTLITRAIDKLRENPFCGIQIKKEMIPKKYKKYGSSPNLG